MWGEMENAMREAGTCIGIDDWEGSTDFNQRSGYQIT
jgi:hypothetical protein